MTGLELTAEFCRVATMLTARTGLADQVTFRHGNALDMPFPDQSFDAVWTEQFAMHISQRILIRMQQLRIESAGARKNGLRFCQKNRLR